MIRVRAILLCRLHGRYARRGTQEQRVVAAGAATDGGRGPSRPHHARGGRAPSGAAV